MPELPATQVSTSTLTQSAPQGRPLTERPVSLDAFRDATMALMVLVNTPGDGGNTYAALQHARWNGYMIRNRHGLMEVVSYTCEPARLVVGDPEVIHIDG
jgi:hypothetical protein